MTAERRPPRFPLAAEGPSPLETIALAAVALAAALSTALWITGEVAGRVFGGRWPGVGLSDMGSVLARMPAHAHDPGAAWPLRERSALPGAAAFYSTMLVLFAPAATVGVYLVWRHFGRGRTATAARWARRRDLSSLRIRRAVPGRLTLGLVGGRLVAAEPRQSVIVVGPVQTGKTSGFAVPAILEWKGPVVATSVKTDLLRETLVAREAIAGARVWMYDPTGSTGIPGCGWTPLSTCGSWTGAQRVASWLVAAAHHGSAGVENAEFWHAAAAKLLAPVLFAAAASNATMADVVRWIDAQEQDDVFAALDVAGDEAAITAFQASSLRDDRTRSGVYTTAETVLAAYADPGVLASALTSELRAERLLDGGAHTAYLCAPAHEQRRLQPLFATLVQEIVAVAYERSAQTGEPLTPPLLLVLDECANIAPLRELATLASTGAGQGIQLVSVFQDMAQINAVYGRDRAPTIVSNHRAKVILSGIADAQTLDYVSRLLGDEETLQTSSTSGVQGSRSTTESVSYRKIAPANVLREMRPGDGLLVYGHLAPARITLRPWFKNRKLQKVAAGAVP
jgi:type IV secretion system protein VirD4